VAWIKGNDDIEKLAGLQARLLDKAAELLKPGGRLVYCTCSLEPEEGEEQAGAFLARHPYFVRERISADEIGGLTEALTPEGDLRTLPCHLPLADGARGGLDGFFAARFVRREE
jgi:16S rRNA (cytosine967-C5)-methyltransferase